MTLRIGTRKPSCGFLGSDVTAADLAGQLGRRPLVGVDGEDPVARGQPQRGVALAGEVVEGPDRDPVGAAIGDGLGLVAAGAVDDAR